MHRSVLTNSKYMEFSAKNTVEVISVSGVREAAEGGDDRAATYEGSNLGVPVEFLCQWPGLTVDDHEALRRTKAGSYNDTGGVPFTCLVNPHDEAEMARFKGGTPAGDLMEAVEAARETLEEEHGEGFERKTWNKITGAEEDAWEKVAKGDYTKALKVLDKAAKKMADWPEAVQARATASREAVIGHAERALDTIEELAEEDAIKAKKALRKLRPKLKGTGLEERATELTGAL